jgi:single-strand DNA-binding protein
MAGSVNKCIIVGNVVRDPEIRTTQSGMKIANLSVATNESWTDKTNGERKEKAEFHRISCLNERIADVIERFVRKGKKAYVEGSLQTRKWSDQSGQEKHTTEIVIDRFRGELTLLDSGRGDDERAPAASRPATRAPARAGASWDAPKDELDSEIPF